MMTVHGALINMREGRDFWEQGQNAVSRDAVMYTQFSGGFSLYECGTGGVF